MRWVGLLLLAACSTPERACLDHCAAFLTLAQECPEDSWGPFEDLEDFRNGCETWAWEISLLAREAGEVAALQSACELSAEEASRGDCGVLSSFDYDALPWP